MCLEIGTDRVDGGAVVVSVGAELVVVTLVPGVVSRYFPDEEGATLRVLDAAPGGARASDNGSG